MTVSPRSLTAAASAFDHSRFLSRATSIGFVYGLLMATFNAITWLARPIEQIDNTPLLFGLLLLASALALQASAISGRIIFITATVFSCALIANLLYIGRFNIGTTVLPSLLLLSYIVFEIQKSSTAIWRLDAHDRQAFSIRTDLSTLILGTLGISSLCRWLPPVQRTFGAGLLIVSTLALSASILIIVGFLSPGGIHLLQDTARTKCSHSAECASLFILTSTATLAALTGAAYGMMALALFLGRKISRISVNSLRAQDVRPPILFLRSFSDDQVALKQGRRTLLGGFVKVGDPAPLLDHVLLEEASDYGPVVAIGDPRKKPPFGIARTYPSDEEDWKAVVATIAEQARFIVIAVDDTPGVRWEISHIASKKSLASKTLYLLPPRFSDQSTASGLIMASVSEGTDAEMTREIYHFFDHYKGVCLGWYFQGDRLEILTADNPLHGAYVVGLRAFILTASGIKLLTLSNDLSAFFRTGWSLRKLGRILANNARLAMYLSVIALLSATAPARSYMKLTDVLTSQQTVDLGLRKRTVVVADSRPPFPGEVVYYRNDKGTQFVRRYIAREADIVSIHDRNITVNGIAIDLSFVLEGSKLQPKLDAYRVPSGKLLIASGATHLGLFSVTETATPPQISAGRVVFSDNDIGVIPRGSVVAGALLAAALFLGPLFSERYLPAAGAGQRWLRRAWYAFLCLLLIAIIVTGTRWQLQPWPFIQYFCFLFYARFAYPLGLL